jgi:hypothetical protein
MTATISFSKQGATEVPHDALHGLIVFVLSEQPLQMKNISPQKRDSHTTDDRFFAHQFFLHERV